MALATQAVVKFDNVSGFAEDAVVNTFTIFDASPGATTGGAITLALASFYNGLATGQTERVGTYLSQALSRAAGGISMSLYDISNNLDGSPHGPAYFTDTATLVASSTDPAMADEVAYVVTMIGEGRDDVSPEVPDDGDPSGVNDPDIARDRPMQRRTGRIYLGPLNTSTMDNTYRRPSNAFRDNVVAALQGLNDALQAGSGGPYELGVWSRKNSSVYPVVGGFVDNAWDTQRRRGVAPNTRIQFGL